MLGTDDTIYVADMGNDRVRALAPSLPGLSLGEFTIASEDGRSLFVFDRSGRHLRTVDTLTKAVVLRFSYDSRGRLTGIENGDGLMTHDPARRGRPADRDRRPARADHGLQVSAAGYLSRIQNPAGDRLLASYDADGLLTQLTDPRDGVHRFEYDALGRLTRDEAPDSSSQTLTRTVAGGATTVTRRSGEGRDHDLPGRAHGRRLGRAQRDRRRPGGRPRPSPATTASPPSPTPTARRSRQEVGPDPRFGMQSPVLVRMIDHDAERAALGARGRPAAST